MSPQFLSPLPASTAIRLASLEQEEPAPNNAVSSRRDLDDPNLLPPPNVEGATTGVLLRSDDRPPLEVTPEPVAFAPPASELDLAAALVIARGRSPRITAAGARYREAYARVIGARALWLPSIRAGASYHHHDGRLQDVAGNVIDVSRSTLNAGMGVNAVGAGSPAAPGVIASFHTADALFQPSIAEYAASARYAATRTETNDVLLDVAVAYNNLLRAVQQLRIVEATRDRAQELADLTRAFAESGQGTQADADRMQAELARRINEVARAEEAAVVASARLGELLSLDPLIPILPLEPTVVAVDLVHADAPLGELLSTGLSNRPELAEARYLVAEAVQRYQRERFAPFIPSVLLGVSGTGFGGGIGSDIDNFSDRFDFDAAAYWEVRNLGFGERAQRRATLARHDQARMQQVQTMDRVAREIIEAQSQVAARRRQIPVAEAGITAAADSYRRNLQRIREGQGLPIEVLQSVQALDDAHREYLRAVMDYNEAQFRLQRALGWPIP